MSEVTTTPEITTAATEAVMTDKVEATNVEATNEGLLGTGADLTNPVEAGKQFDKWYEALSPELKDSSFVTKFREKTLEDMVNSAISAEKLIGKKVEDFSIEEMDKYYQAKGMPENKDDYMFAEELTEAELYKDIFHEAKLTKDQGKMLTDKIVEAQRQMETHKNEMIQKQLVDTKEALQKEFGNAYDERINLATNTLKEFGGDELLKQINDAGLGANADFIKMMSKLGKTLGEDRLVKGDVKGAFGVSPDEAKAMIDVKRRDQVFMDKYMAKSHNKMSKEHKAAVAEMEELFKLAYDN